MPPAETTPRVLALVPARAGSKGIPGKNLRLLAGKPLLAHAVAAGRASGICSRILITTDDPEMARVACAHGAEAPFLRPPELARDDTPMLPVLQHAVRFLEQQGWLADYVLLLQPTSPFRRPEDLRAGLAMLASHPEAASVVSVERVPAHLSPHYVMRIAEGRLEPFLEGNQRITRRQDAPPAYSRNGDFYLTRRRVLMEENSIYGDRCLAYVTAKPVSVNLDTLEDWAYAEWLAGRASV